MIGIAHLFLNLTCFDADCFNKSLSNIRLDPSIISISGFYPRHWIGKITGIGLSWIITINSSLNLWGESGIAQTLIS